MESVPDPFLFCLNSSSAFLSIHDNFCASGAGDMELDDITSSTYKDMVLLLLLIWK